MPTIVHTADVIIQKASTKTHTADTYLSKLRTHTADAIVSQPAGSFRGIGTISERDALAPKYAGDTYLSIDDENNRHAHYWTGSFWIDAKHHQAAEGGIARNSVAPTTAGWRFEVGDPTYPFQHWDGSVRNMYGKSDGTLYGNNVAFGSASLLSSADYIDLPEVAGASALTPTIRQVISGTATSTTVTGTWSPATAAGNFLLFKVGIESSTATVTTPPTGFTLLKTASHPYSPKQIWIYGKANSSGADANPSITFSASVKIQFEIAEVTNIVTTSVAAAVDSGATTSNYGNGTHPGITTPAANTVEPQEVWIVGGFVSRANTYSAPTNGFAIGAQSTTGSGASGHSGFLLHRVVTSQGVPTSTVSQDGSSSSFIAAAVCLITAGATSDSGTPAANHGRVYVTDRSGVSAPFFQDDAANAHPMTEPPGSIKMYGGSSAPTGYVLCDGASLLRSGTYAALYAVIGTSYGSADGTHFNVPDLRQRFPLGLASSGTGSTMGDTGGTISHTHSGPSHNHDVSGTTTGPSSAPANMTAGGATSYAGAAHNHDFSDTSTNDGTGNTGTANPPYVVVQYIISY